MKNNVVSLLMALLVVGTASADDPHRDLLKRAHAGDVVAMRKIGIRKFKGAAGTPVDRKNALLWLQKAADKDDTEAMYYLGMVYLKGYMWGRI